MGKYVKFWEKFYVTDLFSKGARFGTFEIDFSKCKGCGLCVKSCPGDALILDENKRPAPNPVIASITDGKQACAACGVCEAICPEEAIYLTSGMHFSGKFKFLHRGPVAKPRLFSEMAPK